ncbi:MAG: 50S ribosomal protein L10 [Parcubacteria group bacterium SW_4_49_11]|jgi:large subunit ribosomal protein L10|nr:MAG: 50S ribosomal protein L10 [Parcubacteria group bacterium SW_4_49_11]
MPLTKAQKKEAVSELADLVGSHQGAIFVRFDGSNVETVRAFRRAIRSEDGAYKVSKKTLLAKAFRLNDMEGEPVLELEGNIGVVFGPDPVTAAKTVHQFTRGVRTMELAGGVLNERFLSTEEAQALAELPSREELYAQVLGTLTAPVSDFMSVANGNARSFVQLLSAYRDQHA